MATDAPAGGRTVRRSARAKVNLYLHLLSRRPDGYHELDSLIVFVEVADEIEVASSPRLGLRLEGPFADSLETSDPSDNLVIKAAQVLARETGRTESVALTLRKHLPVAAGLGGGSADAAAALLALCDLWELDIGTPRLQLLAASLGADVPACLHRTPVFVGGIGEKIEDAPELPPAWLVLVNPGVPLVTASVFQNVEEPDSHAARFHERPADVYGLANTLGSRSNDLEGPAIKMLPMIADVIAALERTDGCLLARMSGSGATCFGLFADESAACSARAEIGNVEKGWWVKAGRMIVTDTAA